MKVILLLVLLVSIVILLFIRNKNCYKEEDFPKIIWILWLQGWDNAPWLQQRVKESWEKHNPGWEVKCIDENNCPVKIDGDTFQDKADVIRLRLLDKFGGVWADSTMLCMEPLDKWLKPNTDFWMYHGWENCKYGAIWFIISKPGNYLISKWKNAIEQYWKSNEDYGYHATDIIFKKLVDEDEEFRKQWNNVSYECCEDFGSAHIFAGKVLNSDKDLQESLKNKPPHAIKLDKACSNDPSLDNNCTFAVKLTLST